MNETTQRHTERTSPDVTPRSERTRRLTNPNLTTNEYNEALALYLRLRQSLVGI